MGKVSREQGRKILDTAPDLEILPGGTFNIWSLLEDEHGMYFE